MSISALRGELRLKSFAFHSYKGGTGKTFISMNLAILYARKGSNVCLLDFDFRAPSLHAFFDVDRANFSLNELLNGKCEIGAAISDATEELSLPGRLYVGLADPSTAGISEIIAKDRKWQMRSLRLISKSLQTLSKRFEVDYVLFDTSPGFQYSSVNALISSDVAVLVTTPDKGDVDGTSELIKGVYETLERRAGIIVNKVPTGDPSIDVDSRIVEKFSSVFKYPAIEVIPCSCDVLSLAGESIFVQQHPNHPIVKHLISVAEKLEKF